MTEFHITFGVMNTEALIILLWRLSLIASGLFLIGFVSFLIFVEGYGIYLFFTEPSLYFDDIRQHGLTSFTVVYLFINLMLVLGFIWRFINSTNKEKM